MTVNIKNNLKIWGVIENSLLIAMAVFFMVLGGGILKDANADTLNAEIVKAGGYIKLDQKNVTAWLDLRNDAAHRNYSAYDKNQVKLLVAGIQDFITRNTT